MNKKRTYVPNPDEQARRRAVELGESGSLAALDDLLRLSQHPRPTVRRAVASALGKLTAQGSIAAAIPRLCELARDRHPQVRQYAMKALGKTGDEAALPVLRDRAGRTSEPDYNLRSALHAIERIEKAIREREDNTPVACSRCARKTTAEERRRSERQFHRVYCDACFNAVFIDRRNFDMKVQNHKTIQAADRTVVQSRGERRIADWLKERDIAYHYDDKFQLIHGYAIRPDFYLPALDVYIEYWGLDTTDYKIGMLLKKKLYQQEGKRLISVYPDDQHNLNRKLILDLSKLGYAV